MALPSTGTRITMNQIQTFFGRVSESQVRLRTDLGPKIGITTGSLGMSSFNNLQYPIITNGLVLYLDAAISQSYPGYGSTWFDLSGNGNNGTLVNGVGYSGSNLGSLSFNGSNYIAVNSVASSGNAARSVFAWIKTSTGGCIFSSGTAATGQAFNLVTYGSNKIGVMGDNNDVYPSTGAVIINNVWHYVGAVANGSGTIITYVDGVQDNTGTVTYSTVGQNNFVGKSNHVGSEFYWNGSIANVQYYNRPLTASEVQQNFNATRGRYGV